MPVSFLTLAQRERYGRYPEVLSTIELARYFYLDDSDLEWIARKRRDFNRLGYALQLTTVRFLGTFLADPTAVPQAVIQALGVQIQVADSACLHTATASNAGGMRWKFAQDTAIACQTASNIYHLSASKFFHFISLFRTIFAVLKSVRIIPSFQDIAMVRNTIK